VGGTHLTVFPPIYIVFKIAPTLQRTRGPPDPSHPFFLKNESEASGLHYRLHEIVISNHYIMLLTIA